MSLDRLRYPESLPITARREELVAGDPRAPGGDRRRRDRLGQEHAAARSCASRPAAASTALIGHTQPRRVAARTIAERVAEELGTPLGDDVGYTVRFNDQVGDGDARQGDDRRHPARRAPARPDAPPLRHADHRRGPRAQPQHRLHPRLPEAAAAAAARPEGDRHVGHDRHRAASPSTSAPTARRRRCSRSTGRTFPVEVRYRPFGGDDPTIRRRSRPGAGDRRRRRRAGRRRPGRRARVPQRRARDPRHRRRAAHAEQLAATLEVLPLYARLSAAEQHRIFQPHRGRRVVLATNVAETSITVPGMRYVVDAGTARISRYSRRLKVQRLPIEPISQASADQRAGRCGRVAPGICIRLYAEDDFDGPARVHRARDPAHQPGLGHPADDGDRPRRRRRVPVRRAARPRRRSATATCCSRSSARIDRADRRRGRAG